MRVVVLRFSALGDISLLLPVLQRLCETHPQAEVTVVSRPFLAPLFAALPVNFVPAHLEGAHAGLRGLWQLSRQIKKQCQPDVVIDQHNVLRTRILAIFFRLMGLRVLHLKKERSQRKKLTRYRGKELRPLPHVTEKYRRTFSRAGLDFTFAAERHHRVHYFMKPPLREMWKQRPTGCHHLGIAPFARHGTKQWPEHKMLQLLLSLRSQKLHLWFFGSPDESQALERLAKRCGLPYTLASGRWSLDQEVALMQELHAFLAMDSSNMHLATLAGIPVVSVWGATHPYAGFAPLGPNAQYLTQLSPEELDCRPCSVYGARPCFRGDHACMEHLTVSRVRHSLERALYGK